MTTEQAIKILMDGELNPCVAEDREACDMAIKALEQEPCEDCISREAVLNVIEREEFKGDSISEIEKLSSVIPQPKIMPIAVIRFDANELHKILEEAINNIEIEPKWIPVSERLPEESLGSVIGWDAYRERCVFIQYIDGHFQIMGKNESFNIVAWMPVPEPYKTESEDDEE